MLPEVCDNVDFGTTSVLGGEVSIGGVAGDQQAALIGQCCEARRGQEYLWNWMFLDS